MQKYKMKIKTELKACSLFFIFSCAKCIAAGIHETTLPTFNTSNERAQPHQIIPEDFVQSREFPFHCDYFVWKFEWNKMRWI